MHLIEHRFGSTKSSKKKNFQGQKNCKVETIYEDKIKLKKKGRKMK